MSRPDSRGPGLLERLASGAVLCAEGYLFELERRGYVQAGAFVPEAVLEHPDAVLMLHKEFLRAGSDVIEAFTYYGHREKLRLIGKESLLEPLQREALRLAWVAASEAEDLGAPPPLVAGNICNTNVWDPTDRASHDEARNMFEEQVAWAVEAGVDYVIGETFGFCGEAEAALDVIRGAGLPAVVTLALHQGGTFRDGVSPEEAAARLEARGADVVGLNCAMGPETMLSVARRVRKTVSCHVAALPVPYRTTAAQPTFQSLRGPEDHAAPDGRAFPTALDPYVCSRYEMADFARRAEESGIRYLGGCCGTGPHHIRSMAEALGRRPPASRYSPDMSKHYALGTDGSLRQVNLDFAPKL